MFTNQWTPGVFLFVKELKRVSGAPGVFFKKSERILGDPVSGVVLYLKKFERIFGAPGVYFNLQESLDCCFFCF